MKKNQCDGCQRGILLVNGRHSKNWSNDTGEICTKDRYASPTQQEGKKEKWCYACGSVPCDYGTTGCPWYKESLILSLPPGESITTTSLEESQEKKCLKHGVAHKNGGYASCVYYERTNCKDCGLPHMHNVAHVCDEKGEAKLAEVQEIVTIQDSKVTKSEVGSSIKIYWLKYVEVQQNGIIRNEEGRLIARLVDDIDFEGEHIKGVSITAPISGPSSSDWKEKAISMICAFRTGSMDRDQFKANVEYQIEKLIEASREERTIGEEATNNKGWFDRGRAAEREEQNRINNSGRKLFKAGEAHALEKVKKYIENAARLVGTEGGREALLVALAALSSLKTE